MIACSACPQNMLPIDGVGCTPTESPPSLPAVSSRTGLNLSIMSGVMPSLAKADFSPAVSTLPYRSPACTSPAPDGHGETRRTNTLRQRMNPSRRCIAFARLGARAAARKGSQRFSTKSHRRALYFGPTFALEPGAGAISAARRRLRLRRARFTNSRFGCSRSSGRAGTFTCATSNSAANPTASAISHASTVRTTTLNSNDAGRTSSPHVFRSVGAQAVRSRSTSTT